MECNAGTLDNNMANKKIKNIFYLTFKNVVSALFRKIKNKKKKKPSQNYNFFFFKNLQSN